MNSKSFETVDELINNVVDLLLTVLKMGKIENYRRLTNCFEIKMSFNAGSSMDSESTQLNDEKAQSRF